MNITVAITGASGAIYPQRFLGHLAAEATVSRIQLVVSAAGLRVLHEELGQGPVTLSNMVERLVEDGREKIEVLNNNDIGASIASGSFPVDAMVVIPCSVGTLGSIAHGISRDLIQRSADGRWSGPSRECRRGSKRLLRASRTRGPRPADRVAKEHRDV